MTGLNGKRRCRYAPEFPRRLLVSCFPLQQRAVVALLELHHLLFHRLHGAGDLEHRLYDLSFGRLVAERVEERMQCRDSRGDLLGLRADLGDGFGAVHGMKIVGATPTAQAERMPLRIVVTCGPSYEPIDEVRRITNFSTGKLGALLSERLAAEGHHVECLRGEMATWPAPGSPVKVIPFSTNNHLLARLESLPERETVKAVFHAAALADFTVRHDSTQKKLSSRSGELTLTLVPATKLIGRLRDLFPKAKVVGWKYELDGTRETVIARGLSQITSNRTDACILNGAAYGPGFGALLPDGTCTPLKSSDALFDWLLQRL